MDILEISLPYHSSRTYSKVINEEMIDRLDMTSLYFYFTSNFFGSLYGIFWTDEFKAPHLFQVNV